MKAIKQTICALIMVMLTACSAILGPEPEAGGGVGSVTVRLGNAGSRTIMPAETVQFSSYTLDFTWNGGSDTVTISVESANDKSALNGAGKTVTLTTGSWTLTVTAYNTFTVGGQTKTYKAASGSAPVTVTAGNSGPVDVVITLIAMTAQEAPSGVFTYQVSFPESAAGTLVLRKGASTLINNTNITNGAEVRTELAAGVYNLSLNLTNNGLHAGDYAIVQIYPGLESKAVFNFTDDDFTEIVYIAGTATISNASAVSIAAAAVTAYSDAERKTQIGTAAVDGDAWFMTIPAGYINRSIYLSLAVVDGNDQTHLVMGESGTIPENGKRGIALPMTLYGIGVTANGSTASFAVSTIDFSILSTTLTNLGGNTEETPYDVVIGGMNTSEVIGSISTAVSGAGKYVNLDLRGCTATDNTITSAFGDAIRSNDRVKGVGLPSGVTSIGYEAFAGCSGLTSIVIPEGVTSIEYGSFDSCSGLTSIVIPDSVTSIASGSFMGCSALTKFYVTGNSNFSTALNEAMLIAYDTVVLAMPAASGQISIPDGITAISDRAFIGSTGLTSIVIPDSVTKIEYAAFFRCDQLTSIVGLNGMTSIDGSFSSCSGLTSIVIPESVTIIRFYAFSGCYSLTSVTFAGITPPTIDNTYDIIFSSCSSLEVIYVPTGTVAAYRTALANSGIDVNIITDQPPQAVAFNSLTADGSETATTTTLTLTFDSDITGLTESNIIITENSTGTAKGTLTRTGVGVYKLTVSGITADGEITVKVSKVGYIITPNSLPVVVYDASAIIAAANAFKSTHSTILAKTVDTVVIANEDAVDAALTDYSVLSAEVTALLGAEKNLLDSLKNKITALKSGTTFITITGGQMADETFTLTSQTLYRNDPPAKRTVTFNLGDGYSSIRWSVGNAVLTWADGSSTLTFDAADWPAGTYTLAVTVVKNNKSWSKSVTITVANGANPVDTAAAETFKSAHSAVLGKTVNTVAIADEAAVNAALTAYGVLPGEVKALVIIEKGLLDSLKTKIGELKTAITVFTSTHGAVLALTVDSVAIANETAVDAALTAYSLLSEEVKPLLSEERSLLDSLKNKITMLKSGTTFITITGGQMADETFTLTSQTLYRNDPPAKRTVTFNLGDGYSSIRWSVGNAVLTWADESNTFAFDAADWPAGTYTLAVTVVKNNKSWSKSVIIIVANGANPVDTAAAETFKSTHSTILAKTTTTVAITDETAVNAALTAYGVLSTDVKALVGADKKSLLDTLKAKIDALKSAEAFKTNHAAILAKTTTTVAITDETSVDEALTAYGVLPGEVKALVITEKGLLDDMKAKITELNTAITAFTSTHSAVLALTVDSVAIANKTAVDAALTAYSLLSEEVKALLGEEKSLLDSLKNKITALKSGTTFITISGGQMADETFSIADQNLYRGDPAAARTVIFNLGDGYSSIRWSVGAAELTWADGSNTLTFDAADWPAGTYTLAVTVVKNSKSWSKSVTISVANGKSL